MVGTIAKSCKMFMPGFGTYSLDKVGKQLQTKFGGLFQEKGISVILNKLTVNIGQPTWREFKWIEFADDVRACIHAHAI